MFFLFQFLGQIEHLELSQEFMLFFGEEKSFQVVFDSAGGTLEEELDEQNGKKTEEKPPAFYWFQGVEDMVS